MGQLWQVQRFLLVFPGPVQGATGIFGFQARLIDANYGQSAEYSRFSAENLQGIPARIVPPGP